MQVESFLFLVLFLYKVNLMYHFFKVKQALHLGSGVNEAKRLQALLKRTQNLCSVDSDSDKEEPKKQIFAAHPDYMSSDVSFGRCLERARSDDSLLSSVTNYDGVVDQTTFSQSGKF